VWKVAASRALGAGSVRARNHLAASPDPDDDLAFGAALSEVIERLFGLLEREHLVDHRADAIRRFSNSISGALPWRLKVGAFMAPGVALKGVV
jgi:hypothetical protein